MDAQSRTAIETGYQQAQKLLSDKQYVEAARAFASLMPSLRKADDILGQARVLTHLAQIFFLLDQRDQAIEFYREARKLAMEAADVQLQAIATHQIGCLLRESDPQQARTMLIESRTACAVLGDPRGEALALALIGEIDIRQGEREAGMRKMLQALKQIPAIPERQEIIDQILSLADRLPRERFEAVVEQ